MVSKTGRGICFNIIKKHANVSFIIFYFFRLPGFFIRARTWNAKVSLGEGGGRFFLLLKKRN